jgi:AraC-like DNA-binding protein
MENIEVVQVAILHPMISALKTAGAPVDRLLRKAKLDNFRLDNPDKFVPAICAYDFINAVVKYETGPHIPREVLTNYRLENMGNWGGYVSAFSDILSTCIAASDPAARNMSAENPGMDMNGARTTLSDRFAIQPSMARAWMEHVSAHLMLDGLRMGGGKNWVPQEIHFSSRSATGLEQMLSDRNIVFRFDQPALAVVFPTDFLASPMAPAPHAPDHQKPDGIEPMISARLEMILDASIDRLRPTLEVLAEMVGMSPRTLQRRLADEGLNFSSFVDQWRFKRSLPLLRNPRLTVRQIGQHLRYAHASHFVRAFNRWTGTTPQRYRDDMAA